MPFDGGIGEIQPDLDHTWALCHQIGQFPIKKGLEVEAGLTNLNADDASACKDLGMQAGGFRAWRLLRRQLLGTPIVEALIDPATRPNRAMPSPRMYAWRTHELRTAELVGAGSEEYPLS